MNVNDIEKLIAITKPVVKTISKGMVICYKNRAVASQAISKFNEFPKLMLDPRKPIRSAFDFGFTLLFLAMIAFGILNVSVSGIMLISRLARQLASGMHFRPLSLPRYPRRTAGDLRSRA